jgi:hypothetical protein
MSPTGPTIEECGYRARHYCKCRSKTDREPCAEHQSTTRTPRDWPWRTTNCTRRCRIDTAAGHRRDLTRLTEATQIELGSADRTINGTFGMIDKHPYNA